MRNFLIVLTAGAALVTTAARANDAAKPSLTQKPTGFATRAAAAEGLVASLSAGDWGAFRGRLPSDQVLDAWCPLCKPPFSRHMARFRASFDDCAAKLKGKPIKIIEVRGAVDKGRHQRELRADVQTLSDLKVRAKAGAQTIKLEIDNPLRVGGRIHLAYLDKCRVQH